jgi:hypothetical protein
MSVPVRLTGFAVALAVVFGAASLAGAELDPSVDEDAESHSEETQMNAHETTTTTPPGLAVAQSGYRLVPDRTRYDQGPRAEFAFRVVDSAGETVREFDVEHERRMHLIVVRRDFQGFQHLHPQQQPDGTWVAEADLSDSGVYRAFADFSTGGESLTLATDLFVGGSFQPRPLPAPARTADAGDGYEVTIESETPLSEGVTPVTFEVARNGEPLDAIEPYLGADGHLVALREHDQAFLHTHPEGEPGGPGPIEFGVEYPTAGRYRLFLQFKHRGEVRTAAFTQEVDVQATDTSADSEEAGHGDD